MTCSALSGNAYDEVAPQCLIEFFTRAVNIKPRGIEGFVFERYFLLLPKEYRLSYTVCAVMFQSFAMYAVNDGLIFSSG